MANKDKNRKTEAQERFDEADNAGRFAGNDADAQQALQAARDAGTRDTTGYDSRPVQNEPSRNNPDSDKTNEAAHRGSANADEFAGNTDNVNADSSRPLQNDEVKHARNKANESKGRESSM